VVVEENLFDGNRYGLLVADLFFGSFGRNVVTGNTETGVSVKNGDNLEFAGNFVGENDINGLTLQDVRASIRGNQIAGNGERGIGIVSYTGAISGNNFVRNGQFAIDHEGKDDVAATGNWWGGDEAERVLCDRLDDPARGKVVHDADAAKPLPFAWPLPEIGTSIVWDGEIEVDGKPEVARGAGLTISPATRVVFARGGGLLVSGMLHAVGAPAREIVFTARDGREPGAWDEIQLEHARNSIVSHAVFEYATWGLHSHFTNLVLSDSRFHHNYGGMRFRSGPVTVTGNAFTDNAIGIRQYLGTGTFTGNVITRNETGVFVREKGGGIVLHRNNIYANSGYNVRIGDFNDEDVDARDNWWGDGNPADGFFDGRREPGIGKVIYEPFLKAPVPTGREVGP
jgi:hypothetical protein